MDDIRPRPQRQNVNSYPNRVNAQPNQDFNQPVNTQPNQQTYEHQSQEPSSELTLPENKPKKTGKGKTVALVIFILLFIASVGVIAYLYFIVIPKMQKDYDEEKADKARLIQRIDSLEYDNRDLQQKLKLLQSSSTPTNQTRTSQNSVR